MEINLADPVMSDGMVQEADRVLHEEFFVDGNSVAAFEEAFEEYVGVDHAVAVDSGTRALHLSLRSLGISDGDTVLTVPATFIASANVIVRTGATPKFTDISLDTYTIDLQRAAGAIEEHDIDAIVPVHLYGYPVDIPALSDIAGEIPIVGDACQAHGACVDGERVGSYADLTAFSFYPSKNMTVAGDGGMITTDDDELAAELRSLRDVGRSSERYLHERIGYTARLNTVNAAIGRIQLKYLDEWNRRRKEIASRYRAELDDVGDLVHPPGGDDRAEPAWYFYVVRTAHRDALADYLAAQGIETGKQYNVPVHHQPPYRERGYDRESYPNTERWARELLTLPVHQGLSDDQVSRVVDAITEFYRKL